MQYDDDLLQVNGSMYVQGGANTLEAGTLKVAEDFTHISGYFAPSGTHTTVLNGTNDVQHINFPSTSYYFNILDLTRDGSWYVFSPDKCWKTLKEIPAIGDVEVSNISLSARTKTLAVGDLYQLSAIVFPENATNKTLVWTSSNDAVASVDENGMVSALSEGTTTIRVTSSNGLYRTCSVTVHEVFSGTLIVGSVNALPGEEVAVPVTAWDNPGFAAMRITMTYDASLLTPKEIRLGDRLTDNLSFEDHSGSCNILWYGSEDMTEDGILFYMVFKVSDSAKLNTETAISLESKYGDICRADHTNISFSTESGTLLVKDILKGDIYEDGSVDVHDILLLQRYLTKLESLSNRQLVAAELTGDGTVDMKDIVKLAQTLLSEPLLMRLFGTATKDNFVVCVEDAVLAEDGFVNVPVNFTGCPGMAAFRLQINYDADLLELVSIDAVSDLIGENLFDNLSDSERESTVVTWYNATDRKLDGTVFTLRFRLLDDSFSGIVPVSLTHHNADICTASLSELAADVEYGLVHSVEYTSSVQIKDILLTKSGNMGNLAGTIVCGQELNGTSAVALLAFYDSNGKMVNIWSGNTLLNNDESITISGTVSNYSYAKIFAMNGGSWIPLCPDVKMQ